MSFYITIKSAKLTPQHQQIKDKVSVVITSPNNRLFCTFVNVFPNPIWDDAFVASGQERELDFMLVKSVNTGKSAKKISSASINLSKYLFQAKDQIDEIPLQTTSGKQTDKVIIEVCYRESKNFIGPIEFYKKGSGDFDEDQIVDMEIEGDSTKFPFWKRWFTGGDDTKTRSDKHDGTNTTNILDKTDPKDKVEFYKGAHKNRNIFSFCDQVYDDQKFTVVQNYYNDQ